MDGIFRGDKGEKALLQLRQPVNRFPDFVRYAVQQLKTLCPTMGKVKIAQTLARAGLHLSPTTVGRMLKEPPHPVAKQQAVVTGRVVTAKGPNHVWHLDLTIVPTVSGFWTPWVPFALPQCWPFCWWVTVAIDHYSRRLMSLAVFPIKPDSRTVCTNEAYFRRCPANRLPRLEPRQQWPRRSRCAKPRTLVAGQPGDRFSLEVGYYDGRRHLPVVALRRAA